MGRVESLLERVLQRLDTLGDTKEPVVSPPTRVIESKPSSSTVVTPANENAPVLSLFDNGVVCISYIISYKGSILTLE